MIASVRRAGAETATAPTPPERRWIFPSLPWQRPAAERRRTSAYTRGAIRPRVLARALQPAHAQRGHDARRRRGVGDRRLRLARPLLGPRYWQVIYAYRLLLANFGEDRGFMLLKNIAADGRARRLGIVLVDGDYEDVLDLDLPTEWSADRDPDRMRITVRTPNRRHHEPACPPRRAATRWIAHPRG